MKIRIRKLIINLSLKLNLIFFQKNEYHQYGLASGMTSADKVLKNERSIRKMEFQLLEVLQDIQNNSKIYPSFVYDEIERNGFITQKEIEFLDGESIKTQHLTRAGLKYLKDHS